MAVLLTRYISLGLLVAVLFFNLSQRKHLDHGENKRFASLYAAGPFFIIYVATLLVERYGLGTWFFIPAGIAAIFYVYRMRKKIFLFRLRCASCNTRLPVGRLLYYDNNLCETCEARVPEAKTAGGHVINDDGLPEHAEGTGEALVPDDVEKIDWQTWRAKEEAVICYVRDNGRVLLMHKKTGLGKGKINAPGGRIEEGETPLQAAVREVEEEVRIIPSDLRKGAELFFQFKTGYSLHGHVFFARTHEGEPKETREADPFWVDEEAIPYDRMWADDRVWLPKALEGTYVKGYFIFDGNDMVSYRLEEQKEEKV